MAVPPYQIVFDPNGLYLAGNPMNVGLWPNTNKWARYRIYIGDTYDTLIYEGIIYSPSRWARVDISSIFEQYKNTASVTKAKIVLVSDVGVEYGTALYLNEPVFTVYGGAISKVLMRRLVAAGTNIFNWKLKNSNANFFLTTRTNDFVISIPENELMPLYYYAQGHKFDIKADNQVVLSFDHTADTVDNLKYIDFSDLRDSLVTSKNKWLNEFLIVTATGSSCSVLITQAEPSDYFIKFRNSLGAWERIAIHANANYAAEFSEPEISEKFDLDINALSAKNARKEVRHMYEFTTAYKTQDERMHLLDMLLSDNTYLLQGNDSYEVLVSESNEWMANSNGRPVNVTLKIELIDVDSAYSPI